MWFMVTGHCQEENEATAWSALKYFDKGEKGSTNSFAFQVIFCFGLYNQNYYTTMLYFDVQMQ